jgi:hypothetical protein
MKTALLTLIVGTLLAAKGAAQDRKSPEDLPGALLEVDKQYVFTLTQDSRLPDFPGLARVLTPTKDGWVRIEYKPGPPGMGTTLPAKTQLWLNLAHVVTIQSASAKGSK